MALKLKFNPSEPGFWVSGVAHVALLAAAMLGLSVGAEFPEAQEGIPVEIITDNQFSQITKGETNAKEVQPKPKPRAERVADKTEQRDPGEDKRDAPAPPKRPAEMKVADKEEPVAAQPPPPAPPTRSQEDKAAEAKAAEEKKLQRKGRGRGHREGEGRRAGQDRGRSEGEGRGGGESQGRSGSQEGRGGQGEGRSGSQGEGRGGSEEACGSQGQGRGRGQGAQGSRGRQEARFGRPEAVPRQQGKEPVHRRDRSGGAEDRLARHRRRDRRRSSSPSMRDALIGLLQEQIERCYSAPISGFGRTGHCARPRHPPQPGWLARSRAADSSGREALRPTARSPMPPSRAVRRCAPYRISRRNSRPITRTGRF